MKITYKYSEREFTTAMNQIHNFKRVIFDIVVAVALLVYGLYSLKTDTNQLFAAFIVVISILFFFIIFTRMVVVPRVVFRREPKYKEEYILTFNEDEILFSAGSLKSTIQWDYYKRIKETKDFIYLIYGTRSYSIIPKRAFQNNEEKNEFIKLITAKINK
ncbi:YcxB family protein [Paenibacillus oryzisoli]|uniref:YcxB family protein n=1 Tax=Paenibacillus oryzisoli TaxID=1850517 RepID=UPI003D2C3FB2